MVVAVTEERAEEEATPGKTLEESAEPMESAHGICLYHHELNICIYAY